MTALVPDEDFRARAQTGDGQCWSDEDIRAAELHRYLHALAYLKRTIGNDRIHDLLRADIDAMTLQVATWVAASAGRWTTRFVKLVVPSPTAAAFQAWYNRAWRETEENSMRAGHPEHFISHPLSGNAEVIENIGETRLPWRIIYAPVPDGEKYPVAWRNDYPVRFGSRLLDGEGRRVGYTLHELRDEAEGTRMVLTTCLPAAAPATLADVTCGSCASNFAIGPRSPPAMQRQAHPKSIHRGRELKIRTRLVGLYTTVARAARAFLSSMQLPVTKFRPYPS